MIVCIYLFRNGVLVVYTPDVNQQIILLSNYYS